MISIIVVTITEEMAQRFYKPETLLIHTASWHRFSSENGLKSEPSSSLRNFQPNDPAAPSLFLSSQLGPRKRWWKNLKNCCSRASNYTDLQKDTDFLNRNWSQKCVQLHFSNLYLNEN